MGLSASQGRLLLLTARQNDLEYQAQQISQKRLCLQQKLESISSEYENAVNNRQMIITLFETGSTDNKTTVTTNLTYAKLMSGSSSLGSDKSGLNAIEGVNYTEDGYACNQAYRLTDGEAIIVSDVSEIPGNVKEESLDENNKITVNGQVYKVDKALNSGGSDINYLQDCLRNGKYLIEKYVTGDTEDKWSQVAWDSTSYITDQYYEDDDAAAKAKYDRLSAQVEAQDKKLQLELDNVETQRDAVKTEKESVKTVISDNVEKTFDTFG